METGKEAVGHADFRQRTFDFALRIIRLVDALPDNKICRTLGNQLLRSGTSIGANARAARRGRSRAEFIAKMGIVEEEADETIYWLELLVAAEKIAPKKIEFLLKELNEILSITVASIKTARQPKRATA
ncbi:MAG: four helix bundle protein [Terrimicrobiaceae bacterium]|nr:four helix bundle protein [Terrimicrobiaceae bacterium]